jgi:dTDP-4-dehydrorhamnose reductase
MGAEAAELVVGSDSLIGGALVRSLRAAGRRVFGTTRRPTDVGGDTLHLDLANVPRSWNGPRVAVAYLTAGVTRLEACRQDPDGAHRINVEGSCRLARLLRDAGAFVVFLSSNQVFDGSRPYRRTDETPCPLTAYGRQKAEAEARLLELGARVAVVRLTKVLGESVPLFAGWAAAARRGEKVRAFADMRMAPVPVTSVVAVLQRLGQLGWAGVFHLSGERDVSYAEAARIGLHVLAADERLLDPIPAHSVDPAAEAPRHTTLDDGALPARLGVVVPDVISTVRAAFLSSAADVAVAAA